LRASSIKLIFISRKLGLTDSMLLDKPIARD
jgi:hypothetical protein